MSMPSVTWGDLMHRAREAVRAAGPMSEMDDFSVSAGHDLRATMIAAMEEVRDRERPGVRYFLIPAFADAILALLPNWTAKEPE